LFEDKNPKATYGMTPFHLAAEACCDCLKIKIQKIYAPENKNVNIVYQEILQD
jgi:hypothetical protein